MAKKDKRARDLTPEEAEALFADVDETGHTNASKARKEHSRRHAKMSAVEVDPLSGDDPSGSSVNKVMTRTATATIIILLLVVVLTQVSCGLIRRWGTAQLAESADVRSVASAMRNGVEWGNGFTQFPEDFSVQEADESTGRIEVSVVDTSSSSELECLASSQIQAAALAVNALLNPTIKQVIYHVDVHVDDNGNFEQDSFFGFLKPTGDITRFATFVWTKSITSSGGVNFKCTITGIDAETAESLRDKLVSQGLLDTLTVAPATSAATGEAVTEEAATTGAAASTNDVTVEESLTGEAQ